MDNYQIQFERARSASLPNPEQIARNLNTKASHRRVKSETKFKEQIKILFWGEM